MSTQTEIFFLFFSQTHILWSATRDFGGSHSYLSTILITVSSQTVIFMPGNESFNSINSTFTFGLATKLKNLPRLLGFYLFCVLNKIIINSHFIYRYSQPTNNEFILIHTTFVYVLFFYELSVRSLVDAFLTDMHSAHIIIPLKLNL